MKVLNVAEKNDAAKSLARVLSKSNASVRDGFSKYNKLYEFKYRLFDQECHMVFTSVAGHIMNYDFTDQHRQWYTCDPVDLFRAPIQKTCKNPDIE
ncbi:unnamed protein product, partial [Didymodactylos carnosus]